MVNHISDNHSNPMSQWDHPLPSCHQAQPLRLADGFRCDSLNQPLIGDVEGGKAWTWAQWGRKPGKLWQTHKNQLGEGFYHPQLWKIHQIQKHKCNITTYHNQESHMTQQNMPEKTWPWHIKKGFKIFRAPWHFLQKSAPASPVSVPFKAPPHTRLDSCCGFISRTRTPRNRGFVVTHFTIKNEGLVSPLYKHMVISYDLTESNQHAWWFNRFGIKWGIYSSNGNIQSGFMAI